MPPTTVATAASWPVRFLRAASETLNSLRDEWLGWLAVILLTLSIVGLVVLAIQSWLPNEYIAKSPATTARLLRAALTSSFVGTLWILAGTLWSILGVFIPASEVGQLHEWEAQRTLPPREVLRALRVASYFGKSGSIFILLGTIIPLADMLAVAVR